MMEQMSALYEAYDLQVEQLWKKSRVTDGMLGFGKDPRNDPCHMVFYERVEAWIDGFCGQNPQAAEAEEALLWMLETTATREKKECYGMMFAALGLARKLVPLLDQTGAERAFVRMGKLYPVHALMPVQEQLFRDLKRKAGQTGRFLKRK